MESEVYEKSIFDEEEIPVVYAGFWERFGALFLDWLILLFVSFISGFGRSYWSNTVISVITSIIALVYKPLLEYLYGATLGKKALSIVVVNKYHQKPGLQEVVLRNIFGIVSKSISIAFSLFVFTNVQFRQSGTIAGLDIFQGLFGYSLAVGSIWFLIYVADVIVFLADKQNRALHDFIGKTYVIKT